MNYLLTGIETERLKFRLLTPDDFDAWLPLFNTKGVGEFLGMKPGLSQVEQCEAYFKKSFHRYENNLGGMNVLVNKETNHLINFNIQSNKLLSFIFSLLHLNQSYHHQAEHFLLPYGPPPIPHLLTEAPLAIRFPMLGLLQTL